MIYRRSSRKTVDELDQRLRDAAARHKFGLLGVRDLKQTLASKGLEFEREVRVYDICNPHHAKTVLTEAIEVSTALPCRISIYSTPEGAEVATILPGEIMKAFRSSEVLASTAAEVERAMKLIIDDTV